MSLMKKLILITNTHENLLTLIENPTDWNLKGAKKIADFLKTWCDNKFLIELKKELNEVEE